MLGLKRGAVKLFKHDVQWETAAQNTICRLKDILGDLIRDIQHVGSTSVPSIMAKPIIDIAVAADDLAAVLSLETVLGKEGFYYRPDAEKDPENRLLFACGSFYGGTGDLQTHFIHIVKTGSMDWIHYINFRDQLRRDPEAAKAYETLKVSLAQQLPGENCRREYSEGKHTFITHICRKALVRSYLGKNVDICIDRPMGSTHPGHPDIIYPVNYGYLPGISGGDGEELDVYLLGVSKPVETCNARIIGIVHRHNDTEDKLIAAAEGCVFTKEELAAAVHFQEQYFRTEIEILG